MRYLRHSLVWNQNYYKSNRDLKSYKIKVLQLFSLVHLDLQIRLIFDLIFSSRTSGEPYAPSEHSICMFLLNSTF